jgi:hypothetical protein
MSNAINSKVKKAEIPWFDYKIWPTDTKTIIGSVLLAVCFAATMQITERIDTVTTGGIVPVLGLIFQNVWFWPATIYFGLPGGLITATFSPIIAILTGTGPLAPAWFAVNTAHVIPMAVLSQTAFDHRRATKEGISSKYFMTRMVPVAQIFTLLPLLALWIFVLKLPVPLSLALFGFGWLLCFPGGIIAFYMCRSIRHSGVLD